MLSSLSNFPWVVAFEPRLAENAVAINPAASKPTKFASRRGENYRELHDQSSEKRSTRFEVKNYEGDKVVYKFLVKLFTLYIPFDFI